MTRTQKLHLLGFASLLALGTAAPALAQNGNEVEELIVTAAKREQRLKDVAGAISATTGEQLQAVGAQSNADYLGRLPGVVFNQGVSGQSTAVIRGVGTSGGLDQGQGPTGWYLNDVPLTEPGYAVGIPDIDTFDLSRVEVLRGPQGTLFGSSSLGGAINYITNMADPSGYDAAVETVLSTTKHTDGDPGYAAKAMINVPIIQDKLALRVVGLTRRDAGYIDNVGVGKKGSTDIDVSGVRGSVVWKIDPTTTFSLLGMYQVNDTADMPQAHSGFGKYAKNTLFRADAKYDVEIYSARLDKEFDAGTVTALLSRSNKFHDLHSDVSRTNALRTQLPANTPIDSNEVMNVDMTTGELRFASKAGERFDFLVGGMFTITDMKTHTFSSAPGAGAVAQRLRPLGEYDGSDNFDRIFSDRDGEEYALFGEANLHFANDFTFTVGGRLFKSEYSVLFDRYGYSYIPSQHPDRFKIKEDGFVPKFSLRYRPNQDFTAYAVVSKGYRVGNPNTIYPCQCDFVTPAGWDSDSLWNYEVGMRTGVFENRIQLDVAAFYIDWSDIQVRLTRPDNTTYGTNAGSARIWGLETSASVEITRNLNLQTNITLMDAQLTEDVPTASPKLVSGQVLPGASDVQIANTLTWRAPGPFEPTVIFQHRYLSEAPETISEPQTKVGGYHQLDLRLNLHKDQFGLSFWATNLTNEYAAAFGYGTSTVAGIGRQEFIIRPRTFGVTATWDLH